MSQIDTTRSNDSRTAEEPRGTRSNLLSHSLLVLTENEAGVDPREKFRIRYYNDSFKQIALEKKIKNNNTLNKRSFRFNKAKRLAPKISAQAAFKIR